MAYIAKPEDKFVELFRNQHLEHWWSDFWNTYNKISDNRFFAGHPIGFKLAKSDTRKDATANEDTPPIGDPGHNEWLVACLVQSLKAEPDWSGVLCEELSLANCNDSSDSCTWILAQALALWCRNSTVTAPASPDPGSKFADLDSTIFKFATALDVCIGGTECKAEPYDNQSFPFNVHGVKPPEMQVFDDATNSVVKDLRSRSQSTTPLEPPPLVTEIARMAAQSAKTDAELQERLNKALERIQTAHTLTDTLSATRDALSCVVAHSFSKTQLRLTWCAMAHLCRNVSYELVTWIRDSSRKPEDVITPARNFLALVAAARQAAISYTDVDKRFFALRSSIIDDLKKAISQLATVDLYSSSGGATTGSNATGSNAAGTALTTGKQPIVPDRMWDDFVK